MSKCSESWGDICCDTAYVMTVFLGINIATAKLPRLSLDSCETRGDIVGVMQKNHISPGQVVRPLQHG